MYLAAAAKSNAVYTALARAKEDATGQPSFDVPMHIRNAPTGMMKDMGYGEDYRYAHDYDDAFVPGESYFPPELDGRVYYEPRPRGLEIRIAEKLEHLRNLNRQSSFQRYDKGGNAQNAKDDRNKDRES